MVFITPHETNTSDPPGTTTLGIRWFGTKIEALFCGAQDAHSKQSKGVAFFYQ